MRASVWNEHKINLDDVAGNQPLMQEIVRATGISEARLIAKFATLPEMDVYLVFEAQRKAWRGTADMMVGFALSEDELTIVAYDVSSKPHELRFADGIPDRNLVIIHPAEPKIRVAHSRGDGQTVQDKDESGLRIGTFVNRGKAGYFTKTNVRSNLEECGQYGCGSSVIGGADTTRINYFNPQFAEGFFGDLEIEVRAYRSSTHLGTIAFTAHENLGEEYSYPRLALMYSRPCAQYGDSFDAHVWEMDTGWFWNNHDYYGYAFLTQANRNSIVDVELTHYDNYWIQRTAYIRVNWTPVGPPCFY